MNIEYERLAGVLERESDLYQSLAKILENERECLRRMNVTGLQENNGRKGDTLVRILGLEKERAGLMAAIGEHQGLPPEKIRLFDLLRRIPAPWAGRLVEVRERLREQLTRIQDQNEGNRRFVEELSSSMNGIVDGIRAHFSEPALYGYRGKMGAGSLNGATILEQAV